MRLSRIVLALATVALCPFVALADTTYTYNGNDFDTAYNFYNTSNSIQGSFTLAAPLAPNLTEYYFVPESFSFSDGVQALANTTPSVFDDFIIDTDGTGEILHWYVYLYVGDIDYLTTQNEPEFSPDATDLALFDWQLADSSLAASDNNPGTWTESSTSPIPEPSTLALLASGALTLIVPVRRRLSV